MEKKQQLKIYSINGDASFYSLTFVYSVLDNFKIIVGKIWKKILRFIAASNYGKIKVIGRDNYGYLAAL